MSFVISPSIPRTGSQSLQHALAVLLNKTVWYSVDSDKLHWIQPHDGGTVEAFQPVAYLSHRFPNSKFIYLHRTLDSWMDSCTRMYDRAQQRCYNNPIWKQPLDAFPYYYESHRREWEHFCRSLHICGDIVEQRAYGIVSDRTLTWDLVKYPHWHPLCDFLDLPVPTVDFPNRDKHGREEMVFDII